jgi:integrase
MAAPTPHHTFNQRSALRDAALAPATLRTYNKNLQHFLQSSLLSEQRFFSLPPSVLDRRLAEYIEYLYASGGSFDYAAHALNGVVFHRPNMRLQLGESRLRLRGWGRIRRTASHPPLTWELAVVFAVTMAQSGFHASAIALLLSFDCYLRVGELVRLTRADVIMPNDPRMGRSYTSMALRLGRTKTGLNQWVSLRDTAVAYLLQFWMQHTALGALPSDAVFPFSPTHFRRLLRSTATALGVGDIPYVPHSLRHGGATADFLSGFTIEQVMFRGRWKSMESARRYIQAGRALLAMQEVPRELNERGILFDDELFETLTSIVLSVPMAASSRAQRVRFEQ